MNTSKVSKSCKENSVRGRIMGNKKKTETPDPTRTHVLKRREEQEKEKSE